MDNVINVGYSKFWIDNDILHCQLSNNNAQDKFEASVIKLFISAIDKLCNNEPKPFLIDLRDANGYLTRDSANLMASSPVLTSLRISEAYILNKIGVRLVINSYKRIYETVTPFGLFDNLDAAMKYCVESKNNFYGSN